MSYFDDKDKFLSRLHLHEKEYSGIQLTIDDIELMGDLSFVRIHKISRELDENACVNLGMENILSGFSTLSSPLCYLIKGDKDGIGIYVGANSEVLERVLSVLSSQSLVFETESVSYESIKIPTRRAGLVIGHPPSIKEIEEESLIYPICQSMLGKDFSIMVIAKSIPPQSTYSARESLLEELTEASEAVGITRTMEKSIGTENRESKDYSASRYVNHLEKTLEQIEKGIATGVWYTQVFLTARRTSDYKLLSAMFRTSYSKGTEVIEPLQLFPMQQSPDRLAIEPLGVRLLDIHTSQYAINRKVLALQGYVTQTILNSEQLASYFQYPEKEVAGFAVDEQVEFEVENRRYNLKVPFTIGEICTNQPSVSKPYQIEMSDFNRHALLIGMTGSGKTNTSKQLLSSLWCQKSIPFLVIESAKREYWDLSNLSARGEYNDFSDLRVFTLGEESRKRGVPYRINPFEVVGNVSIQAHIDRLFSTFKASFDLVSPTPFILEQALYEIYQDAGWDIVTNENKYGSTAYPSLTDLILKIDEITEVSGYKGEIEANIKASLRARINSLRLGGKGYMLDVEKSLPIHLLMEKPTILELEDLGDDETKSFVIGLLLTQIYEYHQSKHPTVGRNPFKHLLVIEEAHRLLKEVSGEETSKRKAIEFFTNLLAEIRSFGQGIFIIDQIPTKLAGDILKNTNLKIVHRTVSEEDRLAIGKSMNMTEEQLSYLSSLKRGIAAVYSEGDFRPKLVQMPCVESEARISREQVLNNTFDSYRTFLEDKGNSDFRNPFLSHFNKDRIDTSYYISQIHQHGLLNVLNSLLTKYRERVPISETDENVFMEAFILSLNIPPSLQREYLTILKKRRRSHVL
ncbi:ATP-binding protein [Streptococcus suis]